MKETVRNFHHRSHSYAYFLPWSQVNLFWQRRPLERVLLSFSHPRPRASQSVETTTTKLLLSQPTDDGIVSHPMSELSQGPLLHSCSRFLYHRFRIEMLMDRDFGSYVSSRDLTNGSSFSLVSVPPTSSCKKNYC